jgi:hypothetical protein
MWAQPAQAAIAFVSAADGTMETGSATTLVCPTLAITTGNFSVFAVRFNAAASQEVSSATDTASNTYTLGHFAGGAGNDRIELWYKTNATGNGANAITVTFSAAVTFRVCVAAQYSGVALSTPLDATADGVEFENPLVSTSAPFTTTTANQLILSAHQGAFANGVWSAGAIGGVTATARATDNTNTIFLEDRIVSTIQTTITAEATHSVDHAALAFNVAATFKEESTSRPKIIGSGVF